VFLRGRGNRSVEDVHLSWIFFSHAVSSEIKVSANLDSFSTSTSEAEQMVPRSVVSAKHINGSAIQCGNAFDTSSDDADAIANGDMVDKQSSAGNNVFHTSSEEGSQLDVQDECNLAKIEVAGLVCKSARAKSSVCRSIMLLGLPVCRRAAMLLVGVGTNRLQRICRGEADSREFKKPRGPNGESLVAKLREGCVTFLWQCYHQVGEAMPDKFSFADTASGGAVIAVSNETTEFEMKWVQPEPGDVDDDLEDLESRAIAAAVSACSAGAQPGAKAAFGPGICRGPTRWMPPCKKIHLWWEYRALQSQLGKPVAGFTTFRQALKEVHDQGVLRIRKAQGMHAVCQVCAGYKKELKNFKVSLMAHEQTLRLYTEHLVSQWLDRQVLDHMKDMSEVCMSCLAKGIPLPVTSSVLTFIVDGMDQAKFRVPRQKVRSHAFETLLRPALHVQGIWAYGAGYHMAVSDADAKKDTVSNCEVIARMLDEIYDRYDTLPAGLHLQQDNTSRECKNQKMLKFAVALVSLGVFRWVTLAYLITGHTHNPLDGTFGEIAVRLSCHEFDDDRACVELLNRFVKDLGIDETSRTHAKAYKHDESAKWDDWWDQLELSFSNLTGPDAPHYFRVCLRRDIGSEAIPLPHVANREMAIGSEAPLTWAVDNPDDIVVVIKERMASLRVSQVIALVPAALRRRMLRCPQPQGIHSRRPGGDDVKAKCARVANKLLRERVISADANKYLTGWAAGTLPREARPLRYAFLQHRWRPDERGRPREDMRYDGGVGRPPCVRVSILGVSGEPLPDNEDDEDNAELVEAANVPGAR
jgi:hypothetical protein